jgi:hypothetical protein
LAAFLLGIMDQHWSRDIEIRKTDDEQQVVFGWLSVAVDKDGQLVVDLQDDVITPSDLEKAAYNHVLYERHAGEMHKTIGIGRIVESMVFTQEKQDLLGIPPGVLPQCAWWVGYKIDDPTVWKKVKDGTYRAWSIGGTGKRVPYAE